MEQERFTVGELAALAGVSPRTIRYYDKKGLLSPIAYSENQYRQYDKSSLLQLQQVLMLKYLGFSLEEIIGIFQSQKEMSVTELLAEQKRMLLEKREQLDQVISVVEKTQEYCSKDELELPQLSELVKMVIDNKSAGQIWGYYEKYGSKQQDWYPWLFRQLQLQESEKVLDIGCGYGLVWRCSFRQIPRGVQIVALDKAQDELDALRAYVHGNRHLLKKGTSFSFENVDINQITYGTEVYDCIISFHMWPYIENRTAYLAKALQALKPQGRLCANFNCRDYESVDSLLKGFSRDLDIRPLGERQQEFSREIEKDFRAHFPATNYRIYENELHISDSSDLYRFLLDRDAIGKQIAGYGRDFVKYLDEYLKKEGKIVIPSRARLIYAKTGFLIQESSLFNLTIRENLLFGREAATEAQMTEACTRANIMDFIRELLSGFETLIGKNGIRLSGGQRQRLMIARLFLQNPEIIVFDEATSALDYQNESEILNLLLRNAGEKTFLMVTHRRTSIAKCGRVMELRGNC